MGTTQLEFTADELLADVDIAKPLVVGGTVCHGGFGDDGVYVSPQTRNRVPAIHAWQAQRAECFGTGLIEVPLATWPGQFPNVAQARFLGEIEYWCGQKSHGAELLAEFHELGA